MKNIVSQIFFTNNLNSKNNEFNLINLQINNAHACTFYDYKLNN